jgi:hypothetical protein
LSEFAWGKYGVVISERGCVKDGIMVRVSGSVCMYGVVQDRVLCGYIYKGR